MSREVYVHDPVYALGEDSENVAEAAAAGLLLSDADALKEAGFETHYRASPDSTIRPTLVRFFSRIRW